MQVNRLYFTFGTDPQFDYGINDYVLVIGTDVKDCIEAFRREHPNRPGSDVLNCADYYKPEDWDRVGKAYYDKKDPSEIIVSASAYGSKPAGFDPFWLFIPGYDDLLFLQRDQENHIRITSFSFDLFNGEMDVSRKDKFILPRRTIDNYGCLTDAVPDILKFIYQDMFLNAHILKKEGRKYELLDWL